MMNGKETEPLINEKVVVMKGLATAREQNEFCSRAGYRPQAKEPCASQLPLSTGRRRSRNEKPEFFPHSGNPARSLHLAKPQFSYLKSGHASIRPASLEPTGD